MAFEQLKTLKLPARSLTYLLLCVCGILLFIFLVIYPNQASLAEADAEIGKLKSRIEEQKILYPVFRDLLRKVRLKETEGLPFPQKTKLIRDDTAKIFSVFKEIVQKSNFRIEDISPDVDALGEDIGYLKMNLVIKGDFSDLRNFLLELEKLPYLEHIERIQIRSSQGTREIHLKLWMAQE